MIEPKQNELIRATGSQSHRIHCSDSRGRRYHFDVVGDRKNAEWHFKTTAANSDSPDAWIPKFITENVEVSNAD